ncbi:MAG: hypothetical protein PHC54_01830 [Candidatus Omnitrophica bacterium]|nr:hypothetical protein [Candidatus Omnitrophota bacterium]MDD5591681.1 hypothetical protein [Candidatus Omnitrophota bacterium]
MKKNRIVKFITLGVVLLLALLFVARFGGPSILRLYLETGIGNCKKIPILCMAPQEGVVELDINKEYFAELHPYKFPKATIAVPTGFDVIQETIKKVYYKKKKSPHPGAAVYLLYEPPNFFIELFPQLKKQGINNNYAFIKHLMYAQLQNTRNLTDTFFVIMKSIFTPDLGDQNRVNMVQFKLADKKGFINYNLAGSDNYFDCNVVSNEGDFFKIYIRDNGATLDLNQVLAIISMTDKIS